MRSWSRLSTLALVGTLVVTPAYAKKPSVKAEALDDRTGFPYGEAVTRAAIVPPQSAMTEGAIIEGTVAVVDRESGHFVLDTDGGTIALVTWPDEVASLDVGDVVRVSLVTGMSG